MQEFWLYSFWSSAALLVYAQIGYPLVARLLAGMFREPAGSPLGEPPRVTLIIPAYNEKDWLKRKLENATAVDYPPDRLEIIVASDGSTDGTVEIARAFEPRIRLLAFPQRRGKASVLNDAVQAATGELLCLCDANVMFRPDAVRRLVERLQHADVGASSGDVRLESDDANFGEGEKAYYQIERTLQQDESRMGSMMGVDGGMYVVRKHLFQPLPPDTILDDFVTTMRVISQGQRIVYEPAAIATENATPTARDEFRRRVRVSAGAAQALKRGDWPPITRPVHLWQFVSHKLLRWAGPIWLVMLLVSNLFLLGAGWFYQLSFALQLFPYLLAVAGLVSLGFRETRPGGIAFYFVMSHVAMGWGLLKGLLNLQGATWTRTGRTVAGQPGAKAVSPN